MEDKNFDSGVTTPMMRQYLDVKKAHQDCLLFYRMGDFFEMFFDDAVIASKELDIALTKRGKQSGQDIPMCGVPASSYELYLAKLIQKGYKVAICDQIETPEEAKQRGAKGPLKRGVVRIVTKGTLTEDELLTSNNNYIVSLSANNKNVISVAIADVSTGFLGVESFAHSEINNVLSRWSPSEIVLSDELYSDFLQIFEPWKKSLTLLPKTRFNYLNSKKLLEDTYEVKSVDIFGEMNETEIESLGVLINYINTTQCCKNISLSYPLIVNNKDFMSIDAATRKNLEISQSLSDNGSSLFSSINSTVTTVGKRLLHSWIISPLLDINKVNYRLDKIDFFLNKQEVRNNLLEILSKTPDIERVISRICFNRASPRDLNSLKIALSKTEMAGNSLLQEEIDEGFTSVFLSNKNLLNYLENFLIDEPSNQLKDGDFVKYGFDEQLDHYKNLRDHAADNIKKMQETYISATGISNLKIKKNNIWGIYIEVSSSHVPKVPYDFIHKQTLTNCTRYTTVELQQLEKSINEAEQLSLRRELELFNNCCSKILESKEQLLYLSKKIAEIDVFLSMANISEKYNYVRPELCDERTIEIIAGRHPVVEQSFFNQEDSYISNDCFMSEDRKFLLITGPNMAGKSTYLRQNALIIIMAQAGFFVPAEKAKIGIVDRIFSRIGASDDISAGRSTFMVEMIETATILHQATEKSFVILDEIGRGTATYDGLSIAWSVSEYLYNKITCRTIFATHYHEMVSLTESLPYMIPITAAIKEWDDKIIFLYKIIDGYAKQSYGINVAQLAGLPKQVILRAKEILGSLERKNFDEISVHDKKVKKTVASDFQKKLF